MSSLALSLYVRVSVVVISICHSVVNFCSVSCNVLANYLTIFTWIPLWNIHSNRAENVLYVGKITNTENEPNFIRKETNSFLLSQPALEKAKTEKFLGFEDQIWLLYQSTKTAKFNKKWLK